MPSIRNLKTSLSSELTQAEAEREKRGVQASALADFLEDGDLQVAVKNHGKTHGQGTQIIPERRENSLEVVEQLNTRVTAPILEVGVVQDIDGLQAGTCSPAVNEKTGRLNYTRYEGDVHQIGMNIAVIGIQEVPPEAQIIEMRNQQEMEFDPPIPEESVYRFTLERWETSGSRGAVPVEAEQLAGIVDTNELLKGVLAAVRGDRSKTT